MAEILFYCVAATQADLTGMTESNIATFQPHPTEFHEGVEVGTSGDGFSVELGFASSIWRWTYPLHASEWGTLMGFVGTAASGTVYIRCRTNQISGTEYEYKNFVGIMKRPRGESRFGFQFENVEIEFIRLVEI